MERALENTGCVAFCLHSLSLSLLFRLLVQLTFNQLVFAHCDLLCANVIVLPTESGHSRSADVQDVHFIDYEYANPSPAAFDLANHFAEWAGYDCDYSQVPTRSVRRAFLREYVQSYRCHRGIPDSAQDDMVDQLYDDVERFRGIPGLYW